MRFSLPATLKRLNANNDCSNAEAQQTIPDAHTGHTGDEAGGFAQTEGFVPSH
ncbi:MAG: hypothetical protein H8E44_02020 [Planctomycetes bacterium]|nr:hypothetical protein [Planctomycetota bacterium]